MFATIRCDGAGGDGVFEPVVCSPMVTSAEDNKVKVSMFEPWYSSLELLPYLPTGFTGCSSGVIPLPPVVLLKPIEPIFPVAILLLVNAL